MRGIGAFLLALLLTWSVAPAVAAPLIVRSGDHPTYNRITIPLAAAQTWRTSREGNRITITLPDHRDGFASDTVFARMSRDRIVALDQTDDTLTLTLGCACDAAVFVSGPLLVVDVADAGTALVGTAIKDPTGPATAPFRSAQAEPAPTSLPTPVLPWIGAGQPMVPSAQRRAPAPRSTEDAPLPAAERAALLTQMQETLTREVAAAASLGLLQVENPIAETESPPRPPNAPAARALPDVFPADTDGARNMRITSSMDLPDNAVMAQATGAALNCPPETFLPVHSWGEPDMFNALIGPARDALYNARDVLDPAAAERLAKLYLYYGFGAEALSALALAPELRMQHPELVAVATILEQGKLPVPNVMEHLADCPSDVALWATLGFGVVPEGTLIDTDAALRALNELPAHLRHFLAPALSDRLRAYGDMAAAAMALRSIERLPDTLLPDATLAQAQLALETGGDAAGQLETVIATNSDKSPEALVALVNATLSADEPLSRDTSDLVEAYAQELRGTEVGNELRKLQVLALSQSGQFEDAFATLDALTPALSAPQGRDMRATVLAQLTKRADDLAFLDHVFRQDRAEILQMPPPVLLSLGERLMTLGFAGQVQALLGAVPDRPRNARRQILAARAAIGLRQPFQAQAALIGIDGPDAALLMAQAKEMTGAYDEAAALFSSMDAEADAIRAAWLSDQWEALVPPDTPTLGPVARVAAATSASIAPEAGPLGRASAVLSESEAARAALTALLRDPALGFDAEPPAQ